MPFPDSGLVYDYKLDDAGLTKSSNDDDEEEEDDAAKDKKVRDEPAYVVG